ncbi:MAG: helix-turn-helix transcriptional regulator [Actinomycetota bacterium]|nr:helix-turn-helix transcriptional regulator [Actinomycetota bacterium]
MKGGQFVREARRRAGLTQDQLAARVGLSQPTIARIESGRHSPSFERLTSLVRAAGFDLVVNVVPLDDDNFVLAQQNARRSPDERLQAILSTLEFAEAGRRAMKEARG